MDGKPPPRRKPEDLAGYLEALSRPVFQAGISWRVIDAKWDGIREAFAGFDARVVVDFGPREIERLLGDPGVVRSKAKIEATIDNAQALLELDAEFGGFDRYLRSHGGFEETVADLKNQFRYIGDSGAFHFLYVVDEPVPPHDEWLAAARGARGQCRARARTPQESWSGSSARAAAASDGSGIGP
jgi:DNA-3-methyladenine glycosylase I